MRGAGPAEDPDTALAVGCWLHCREDMPTLWKLRGGHAGRSYSRLSLRSREHLEVAAVVQAGKFR